MANPLGLAGSPVGILSLGLQVGQGLLQYYDLGRDVVTTKVSLQCEPPHLIELFNSADIDFAALCARYLSFDEFLTALFYAAMNGRVGILKLLLPRTVNPDAADHFGLTPLAVAVRHSRQVIMELLLAADGTDPASRDAAEGLHGGGRTGAETPAVELLEQSASVRGVSLGDDLPPPAPHTPLGLVFAACNICMGPIAYEEPHYECAVCNDAEFRMCAECEKWADTARTPSTSSFPARDSR